MGLWTLNRGFMDTQVWDEYGPAMGQGQLWDDEHQIMG